MKLKFVEIKTKFSFSGVPNRSCRQCSKCTTGQGILKTCAYKNRQYWKMLSCWKRKSKESRIWYIRFDYIEWKSTKQAFIEFLNFENPSKIDWVISDLNLFIWLSLWARFLRVHNLRFTKGQNTTGRASVGYFLNYRLTIRMRTDMCMD